MILNIHGERILGDGHHRLRVCQEHGIEYQVCEIKLASRELAIQWVIDKQLGRRNLTDKQRAYYMGKEYLLKKQSHGGQQQPGEATAPAMGQNVPSVPRTSQVVADKYGVDEKTVRRSATFAAAVDEIGARNPAEKEAILGGRSGATRAQVIRHATPSIFCPRCQRVGPVKDCPSCKAANRQPEREPGDDTEQIAAERAADRRAARNNGKAVFDWRLFQKSFGTIVRQVDSLAKYHGLVNSAGAITGDVGYREIHRKLNDVLVEIRAWYKQLSQEELPR